MFANELKLDIIDILSVGLVPMVAGPPGVGKSDIIRDIAREVRALVIDYRLAQCDPTDLLGFPSNNGERMCYLPPGEIPLEGDELPFIPRSEYAFYGLNPEDPKKYRYNGWILFLDEFTSAFQSVQAAAYKVVLDKKVGQSSIHKKCAIVCAGNRLIDNAIVTRMGTAMQSRVIHLELEANIKEWVEWANKSGIDHRIVSYLESHPKQLHLFKPDHDDKTFACPRTWEFASKLIKDKDVNERMLGLLRGTISEGVAHEFNAYLQYCAQLPDIKEILARPDDIDTPTEPGLLYAVSNMVAAYVDKGSADKLIRYIKRLPLEFGTTSIRAALARQKNLLQVPSIREWAHEIALEIF